MKLICAQSDLNTHLSLVGRAVPSRPTHPVLANVLLTADETTQKVSLTAFDLSLGIQTTFAAQVEVGGTLTLPAKLLNDIVARLPGGEVTLADEGEGTNPDAGIMATLTSASGKYQVRGLSAEDFPELPAIADGEVAQLSPESLIEGLRGSLFAASTDETKQVLTGVHLVAQQDSLEFAATDGHRLAVVQSFNQGSDSDVEAPPPETAMLESLDVTVPAKTLRELERMLAVNPPSGPIVLRFDRGQIVFEWVDQRLTSRLLEGQYPNYRQLIPAQFARQMTVERRLFLAALERIAVLADQKNNVVKLSLDSDRQEVAISVEAQDVGSGREAIPAQISGDDLDVAFNVKYLMDGLKALTATDVQMQLNTATSPVVLSPLGGIKITYLVMPVQVRS